MATVQQEVTTDQTAAVQAQASRVRCRRRTRQRSKRRSRRCPKLKQTLATDASTLTSAQATLGEDQGCA